MIFTNGQDRERCPMRSNMFDERRSLNVARTCRLISSSHHGGSVNFGSQRLLHKCATMLTARGYKSRDPDHKSTLTISNSNGDILPKTGEYHEVLQLQD